MTCPSPGWDADRPWRWRFFRLVSAVCRWTLGVVFLMAGVTKVTDLQGFADQVLVHSGLPSSIGRVVAAGLPWLELTCAACLLAGYAVREAAALLAILLILLLAYSLLHENERDCACFVFPTAKALAVWWWPPVRNGLLLLCALRTAWR
ncbi:MAG TPA: MauE/DoxX family redox-associated membrane protein [Gemmataceae bacterium]|nr:MauE/DoxX family redox-associated membrane protein [Gemmataceae bacterium]